MADEPAPSFAPAADRLRRVPEIDGLRALAVLLVVYAHIYVYTTDLIDDDLYQRLHRLPFTPGTFGVDIFFAISGFFITTIIIKSVDRSGFMRWFYFRRALRILPLAYLGMALATALAIVYGYPVFWQDIVQNAFYIGNYRVITTLIDPGEIGLKGSLEHYWSLAIEEQFYIVWPLLLLVFRGVRARVSLLAVIVVGSVAVRAAVYYSDGTGPTTGLAYYFTLAHVDGLALGAAAAMLTVHSTVAICRRVGVALLLLAPALVAALAWVEDDALSAVVTVASAVAFVLYLASLAPLRAFAAVRDHSLFTWLAPVGLPLTIVFLNARGHPITHLAAPAAATGCILVLVHARTPWNAFYRFAPFAYLGRISYGIYVYHYILFTFSPDIVQLPFTSASLSGLPYVLLRVPVVIAVAALSWHFFERPILQFRDRHVPLGPPAGVPEGMRRARRLPRPRVAAASGVALVAVLLVASVALLPRVGTGSAAALPEGLSLLAPSAVTGSAHFDRDVDPVALAPERTADGNAATGWHSPPPNGRTRHYLAFDFGEPRIVRAIDLTAGVQTGIRARAVTVEAREGREWRACGRLERLLAEPPGSHSYVLDQCPHPTSGIRLVFDDTLVRFVRLDEVRFFGTAADGSAVASAPRPAPLASSAPAAQGAGASAPSATLVMEDYAGTGYNVIEYGGTFYALHRGDGPFVIEKVLDGSYGYPVFSSHTLDLVQRVLDQSWAAQPAAPPAAAPVQPAEPSATLVVENYDDTGYNVIEYGGTFYALHQGEGAFLIEKVLDGSYTHPVFSSHTLELVQRVVDRSWAGHPPAPAAAPAAAPTAEPVEPSATLVAENYAGTGYNIIEYGGTFYALHQGEGAFLIEKVLDGSYTNPVFSGRTLELVQRAVDYSWAGTGRAAE